MSRNAVLSVALALCACAQPPPTNPRVEAFAKLPDWSGIWLAEGLEPGIDGFSMSRPPAFMMGAPGVPWNETTMARLQAELATNPGLRWQGDTLVIDTVSVREPNKYFGVSAWLSDEAQYHERLRLVGPNRIEGEMTIVDPATLAEPWVVKLNYLRADGWDRLIHDSYDNDRTGFDGDYYTIEQPKAAPAPQ
jgi:hypothetical protein